MNKVLSFPNQQQSMAKKFVKEGPGAYQEINATNDIISVLVYHLRIIVKNATIWGSFFNILALALIDPDWTPC